MPLALNDGLTQHSFQMGEAEPKRTYLVVIDDSSEARVALRFAARRAIKTDGLVEVLRSSSRRISSSGAVSKLPSRKSRPSASRES